MAAEQEKKSSTAPSEQLEFSRQIYVGVHSNKTLKNFHNMRPVRKQLQKPSMMHQHGPSHTNYGQFNIIFK